MKVAVVHSAYRSDTPSGENRVVADQLAALDRAGHTVRLISRSSDDHASSALEKARLVYDVAFGRGASPLDELSEFQPDIVHVHNLFPNWGNDFLYRWPGPVVATLHNFRAVCSAGTLYRDGRLCTRCPDSSSLQAVLHRCYRGSAVASVPLAIRTRQSGTRDALLERADRLIVLSERSRAMFQRVGVREESMALIPNFVVPPDSSSAPQATAEPSWVWAGRVTDEKGLLDALPYWPSDVPLTVLGNGPLLDRCREIAPPSVVFRGAVPEAEARQHIARCSGLLFTSKWAEGAVPIVYLNALAAAKPVIAYAGSAAADDLQSSGLGGVVRSFEELQAAVAASLAADSPAAQEARREHFDRSYSEAAWLLRMESLYSALTKRTSIFA